MKIDEMIKYGKFIDKRDGQTYRTIKIGSQIWMAENLNYDTVGSVYYDNDPNNGMKYGHLYNWKIAKKVSPAGWHLPNNEEWKTLIDYIGDSNSAGEKLKTKSGWFDSGNGTDEYGFSALPGGYGVYHGMFDSIGIYGGWWSATEDMDEWTLAYQYNIYYRHNTILKDTEGKDNLLSVRCVRDNTTNDNYNESLSNNLTVIIKIMV